MSKPTVKITWHGREWMARFMDGCERNMDAAAIALQGHIIEKISQGQPPSRPGEPPHVLTGHLHRNIGWDRVAALVRKVGVGIGNTETVGYALWLEFGTAARKVKGRIMAEVSRFVKRTKTITDASGEKSKIKTLQKKVERQSHFRTAYTHGGMAARPYLRPGLYEFTDEIIRIMTTPIRM